MSTWHQALAEFNKNRSQYIIPKKGTDEYNAVKAIQSQMGQGCSKAAEAKCDVKKEGKGIKEAFGNIISKAKKTVEYTVPPAEDNVPTFEGENHMINIKRNKEGKLTRKNYNYAGPGTKVKQRLQLEKQNAKYQPINNIDRAARQHDIDYTFDVANAVKQGVDKKTIKKMVQKSDDKFLNRINTAKYEDPMLVSVINKAFTGKRIAENTGLLDPASWATGKGMRGAGLQQA